MRKVFVRSLWTLLAIVILGSAVAFTAIWNGFIGYMPPVEDLQNPINRFATQIYSADGKVIGTWNFNRENRVCVSYNDISPYLVQALVATEDVRFYDHSGVDFIALGRAIVKRGLFGQASAGGGSTITQQLAKQLYSETAKSTMQRALQKPIEWVIAVKLERNYTKEEIIALYLNYFDFLHNAVGIKTAANTYFNKEPRDLNIEEAATLIGLCKNPSLFNPVRYPDRCRERRNVVLDQMRKAGYISDAEYAQHVESPLTLDFHRTDHKDGVAPYLREFLRVYMSAERPQLSNYPSWNRRQFVIDSIAWVNDPLYGWCNKNRKKDGSPYNLNADGSILIAAIANIFLKNNRHIAIPTPIAIHTNALSQSNGLHILISDIIPIIRSTIIATVDICSLLIPITAPCIDITASIIKSVIPAGSAFIMTFVRKSPRIIFLLGCNARKNAGVPIVNAPSSDN